MNRTRSHPAIGPRTYDYRKEHSVHTHQIARDLHRERQREIERRLQYRIDREPQRPRRSVRRRVGRGLIQLGLVLEADGRRARWLALRADGLPCEPVGSPPELLVRR
jgi:hypothetical protein